MLTNICTKNQFENGKNLTNDDLDTIYKKLFGTYWNKNIIGGGFKDNISNDLLEHIIDAIDADKTILIFNDISFQLYNLLTDYGVPNEKIFLAYGSFKEEILINNNKLIDTIKDIAKYNFKEYSIMNIVDFKEVRKMCKKFDFEIVNPPYGIGNQVITNLVKTNNFENMICLMPKSKLKGQKLYKYVESIETVDSKEFEKDGASIGDCLTISVLKKNETNKYNSYEELESETYDERFLKFYKENISRIPTFTMSAYCSRPDKELKDYNNKLDFFMYQRVSAHGIDMKGDTYNWNYQQGDINRLIRHYDDRGYMVYGQFIYFKTENEFINFRDYWYRKKLSHLIIKGMNKTGGTVTEALPRVDWSRPWTDEEILKEYGYTEEEIKEILG